MSPIGRAGPEQRLELQTKDGRKVKVLVPDELRAKLGPIRSETRATAHPETPPDPRPSLLRDVPPYGGA